MQPTESWSMLTLIDCCITFAVVLIRPHGAPKGFVVYAHHAPFTTSGHDFVLAKAPSPYVTDTSDTSALVLGSMCLRTILNDLEAAISCQRHYGIHVTWPARQMHANNSFRTRGQHRIDSCRRQIPAIGIHVSEYRSCPAFTTQEMLAIKLRESQPPHHPAQYSIPSAPSPMPKFRLPMQWNSESHTKSRILFQTLGTQTPSNNSPCWNA